MRDAAGKLNFSHSYLDYSRTTKSGVFRAFGFENVAFFLFLASRLKRAVKVAVKVAARAVV